MANRKYLNKKTSKSLNKVNRGRSDNEHVTKCPLSCQTLEGTGAIILKTPAMLSFRKIILGPALTDARSLLARLAVMDSRPSFVSVHNKAITGRFLGATCISFLFRLYCITLKETPLNSAKVAKIHILFSFLQTVQDLMLNHVIQSSMLFNV